MDTQPQQPIDLVQFYASLARIDERTQAIKTTLEEIKTEATARHAEQKLYTDSRIVEADKKLEDKVKVLHNRLDDVELRHKEEVKYINESKVSKDEFSPVKRLSYGSISLIVGGILFAIIIKVLGL